MRRQGETGVDKPFTGEIPEKLPEGYNILLVVTDQERFFLRFLSRYPAESGS